jgi:hypothetical protein
MGTLSLQGLGGEFTLSGVDGARNWEKDKKIPGR